MMLSITLFELRYGFRRAQTYIFFAVLFLLTFLFMTTDSITIGGAIGNVKKNAPFVINQTIMIMTLIGVTMSSGIIGGAVIRDFEFKVHELLYTTPITKLQYVLGRFLGAYLVTLFVFSGIVFGIMIGSFMPWLDADKLGAFRLDAYIVPFIVYIIPNAFFTGALFFIVGILTRNMFAVYVQGMILLVAYSISRTLLSDIQNDAISNYSDPFGFAATRLITRYWTPAEQNALTMPFATDFMLNRVLWVGVAVVLVVIGLYVFEFSAQGLTFFKRKAKKNDDEASEKGAAGYKTLLLPHSERTDGLGARVRQWFAQTSFFTQMLVKGRPFQIISIIAMLNLGINAWYADSSFGTTVYPVTYVMTDTLFGIFIFLIAVVSISGGELIWREREIRLSQTYDALPIPVGMTMTSKIVAITLAQALLLLAVMVAGMIVQTLKGYTNYEIGLYIKVLFFQILPTFAQYTALAFFVHAVVNNKFIGNIVAVLVFIIVPILQGPLHWDHNLYLFGNSPSAEYSDMNGFGHWVEPKLWFGAYWTAWSAAFALGAYLLWTRGAAMNWKGRWREARRRMTPAFWTCFGVVVAAILGTGSYIFYNTNILNKYVRYETARKTRADYERELKKFDGVPQPRITAVKVNVDIFPAEREVYARGVYTLVNKTGGALDSLHVVSLLGTTNVSDVQFSQTASSVFGKNFGSWRYEIYRFEKPLAAGDTLTMEFAAKFQERGFPNSGSSSDIVYNGTFFNNGVFPSIGYSAAGEIGDDDERKKEGLPPRERMPSLDDEKARMNTYISSSADWIDFEATVSTSPDQIAIAPGYLQKEWQETVSGKPRRYFHYAMDSKILNFYSFLSARYEIAREVWKDPQGKQSDVAIEVYYHKGHEYNIKRMIESVKRSLDYYTQNFSPYQHRQMRILEFPRYASFAQSFPNTVPYSEAIGFIARIKNPEEDIDFPFYVTAHEVGHQWWAHQVIGANVQGATLMSESLAEYSALMVMEREYGRDIMQKFLRYDLDRYLRGRASERKKEQPLMTAENQAYIHYSKGSLIMYALKDYIGEEKLNAALARYIQKTAFQEPPYTTSREFVAEIRAATPDSLQYLITDMFERITLYENKTSEASFRKLPDGKYLVSMTVESKKLYADSLGNETPQALGDWVDIGVFAKKGEAKGGEKSEKTGSASSNSFALGKPLYFQKHKITQAKTKFEFTVDEEPQKAGVDPYNKLIDRTPSDNVKELR
jgi:ABC-type transport system involved in multi-copper enzyme maturation permease subunit